MDTRLKQSLEFSNLRNSFEVQKKTIKEKLDAKLTYGHAGGIFKIDQSLICFVEFLISQGRTADVPLLDSNKNPILVSNLNEFKEEILDRYFAGCFDYFNEHQELKKTRNIEKMVGYE
jgi:hypothetical protein